jgi:hypothetical protein
MTTNRPRRRGPILFLGGLASDKASGFSTNWRPVPQTAAPAGPLALPYSAPPEDSEHAAADEGAGQRENRDRQDVAEEQVRQVPDIIEDHACHLDTCLSRFGIPPGAWDGPKPKPPQVLTLYP